MNAETKQLLRERAKPRNYPRNNEYFTLLKKHGLTDAEIAEVFGFTSVQSFRSSSTRAKRQEQTVKFIKLIEKAIITKLT